MGLQSLIFYVTISWLPELLISFGMSESAAGFMLSYFQFVGIPASFIIPVVAGQLKFPAKPTVHIKKGVLIRRRLLLPNPLILRTNIWATRIAINSGKDLSL